MLAMIEFILSRAVLPDDNQALKALAVMLWARPASQVCALFHDALLASAETTRAALEQVKAQVAERIRAFSRGCDCKSDNDDIFDEASEGGLEM